MIALWMMLGLALAEEPALATVCYGPAAEPVGRWTVREWYRKVEVGELPDRLAPKGRKTLPRGGGTWVADGRRLPWRMAQHVLARSEDSDRYYRTFRGMREEVRKERLGSLARMPGRSSVSMDLLSESLGPSVLLALPASAVVDMVGGVVDTVETVQSTADAVQLWKRTGEDIATSRVVLLQAVCAYNAGRRAPPAERDPDTAAP